MQRMGSSGLAGVPAGVTVTPASANSRLALAGNNISVDIQSCLQLISYSMFRYER